MSNPSVYPNLKDVQGNILSNYGAQFATYLLYRVDLSEAARRWLGAIIDDITTEEKFKEKPRAMLNIAVTHQGLKALGLSPTSLNSFPAEFQEGMRKRASILCDFGKSAPKHWENYLGSSQVHIMCIVHGVDRDSRDKFAQQVENKVPVGLTRLDKMTAEGLPDNKEHFGFRDGISQPWIEGTNPGPPIEPYGGKRTKKNGFASIKLGEFLLGYEDELGRIAHHLTPSPLGLNGTYLVLRKLHQDVAEFRKQMETQARYVFGDSAAKDRLAALMVGRWPSGCPVDLSAEKDDRMIAADPKQVNAFAFDKDETGNRCPLGAHIRRTNPRDLELDGKGNLLVDPVSTRHRMIRRGLPYGPPLSDGQEDKTDRGVMFIAVVADIARQFEFVQKNWVNDGNFLRLDSTDRDPLVGNKCDARDLSLTSPAGQPHPETPTKFTVPAATRLPWALNLPEFVTTRGGEYFFLPSVTVLRGIETGAFSSFLKEFDRTESEIVDPALRAQKQSELIFNWLIYRPHEALDELLKEATSNGRIFRTAGYPGSALPTAIVTKYEDVLEVLDKNKHPEMTVEFYRQKMEIPPPRPPRGPFILGREINDPLYEKEAPLVVKAIKQNSGNLPRIIGELLDEVFDQIKKKKDARIDVIQDIAWPVPLSLNARYFGVPGPDIKSTKRWMRNIYRDLFLNLRKIPEWTKEADVAVAEMNPYLDGLILHGKIADSVLKELIVINEQTPGLEPNFVRRNIMGLTVGVVETTLKAIARTIDQLIRRPRQLQDARKAASAGRKDLVLKYVLEAMRFNPQNHVVFRQCAADTTIAKNTPREAHIMKGTLVFVSTLSAMFDSEGPFSEPHEFRLDRRPEHYLFFGHDAHECMGRYLIPSVIQELFMRLLTLDNLRRAKDDSFDPLDLFPEHFYLEFDI